jgi:hypothetical protein
MFCPKCATQNVDGASFCRACGVNISLVPQALTGQLPVNQTDVGDRWSGRKRRRPPTIEEAIRRIMMGIAFAVIALLVGRYSPGGWTWWYWLLIPAASFLGQGISVLARLRRQERQLQPSLQPQLNTMRPQDLPAPKTGEIRTPVPSVTEGTTRHLGSENATQRFETYPDQKPS